MPPEASTFDPAALEFCCRLTARPEMIDENGHLNVGFYGLLFEDAARAFFGRMDLSADYRQRMGRALFVTEQHQSFLEEVREGEPIDVNLYLAGATSKAVHVVYLMSRPEPRMLTAAQETLYLHVDIASGRVVPIEPSTLDRLTAIARRHAAMPRPVETGKRIVLR